MTNGIIDDPLNINQLTHEMKTLLFKSLVIVAGTHLVIFLLGAGLFFAIPGFLWACCLGKGLKKKLFQILYSLWFLLSACFTFFWLHKDNFSFSAAKSYVLIPAGILNVTLIGFFYYKKNRITKIQ